MKQKQDRLKSIREKNNALVCTLWILYQLVPYSPKLADDEHGTLRGQIEQLKTSLDHAQMSRKRKIEYDSVAEKVNTLPSREELER